MARPVSPAAIIPASMRLASAACKLGDSAVCVQSQPRMQKTENQCAAHLARQISSPHLEHQDLERSWRKKADLRGRSTCHSLNSYRSTPQQGTGSLRPAQARRQSACHLFAGLCTGRSKGLAE